MNIDRTNYEIYFIDLIDGKLSDGEVDMVLEFIHNNPDLAEELNDLEKIILQPETLKKFDTSYLLKSDFDQPGVLEESCIRAIENDLSEKEQERFANYLNSNDEAKITYNLFRATISEPELKLVYPKKESLKKSITLAPIWYSVAAVLIIGFFIWFSNRSEELPQPVAQQNETIIQPKAIQNNRLPETTAVQPKEKFLAENQKPQKEEPVIIESNPIRSTETIQPLVAIQQVKVNSLEQIQVVGLAPIEIQRYSEIDKQPIYPSIPELIVQQVSKINLKSEFSKFGKAVLDRFSNATNDNLAYTTNGKGQVNKIEFNSKLLAFSIPVNNSNQ